MENYIPIKDLFDELAQEDEMGVVEFYEFARRAKTFGGKDEDFTRKWLFTMQKKGIIQVAPIGSKLYAAYND